MVRLRFKPAAKPEVPNRPPSTHGDNRESRLAFMGRRWFNYETPYKTWVYFRAKRSGDRVRMGTGLLLGTLTLATGSRHRVCVISGRLKWVIINCRQTSRKFTIGPKIRGGILDDTSAMG